MKEDGVEKGDRQEGEGVGREEDMKGEFIFDQPKMSQAETLKNGTPLFLNPIETRNTGSISSEAENAQTLKT